VAEGGSEGQATDAKTDTHDVFISYASPDSAVAEAVCEALERAGVTCWIAPRDVTPGTFYADEIVHAIDATKAIILILSQNASDSRHVLREVERAASKRHPVVSLRVDQAPLPAGLEYFLNTSQWLDASGGDIARSMPKLIDAVRVAIQAPVVTPKAAPKQRAPAPLPSARQPKRTAIIVASLIGLAIAGFAIDRLWVSSRRAAPTSVPTAAVPAPAPAPAAPTIPEKSVAVLPFVDMSEKKDQEYFSDGLSEELIDHLAQTQDLKVIARTSSFQFKGKNEDMRTIGQKLGVANLLEGSVRTSGKTLRVTAQLIKAADGSHLWSKTYDRGMGDIFKVQDEIAVAVVTALKVSLLKADTPSATLTTSKEAYELYLQARSLISQDTSSATIKAYTNLQQAVSLDPNFGQAWATLAEILTHDNVNWMYVFQRPDSKAPADDSDLQDWSSIWGQVRTAAHAAADQANKLGPDLAESHLAVAMVDGLLDWNWTAADAHLQRALELEPGNARIALAAADISIGLGRVREGLQLAIRAAALDPLGQASSIIGNAQYVSGLLDDALASLRKAIELSPTASGLHYQYAIVLLAKGEAQAALAEMQSDSLAPFRAVGVPLALDALGRHGDADQAIALAEQRYANGMAYQIAYIYAARGNSDRTFYWLERAYRQHDGGLAYLKVDPMFRQLRSDARFKELMRKMKLPE
jgi:TolB-like protein